MTRKTQVTNEEAEVTKGSTDLLAFHDDLIKFISMIEYQLDSNFETLENHDTLMSRKSNGLLYVNRMSVAFGYALSEHFDLIRKNIPNNTTPDQQEH